MTWLRRAVAFRPDRSVRLSEAQLFLVLAFVIGLFSGLSVVCFRMAIDSTRLWLLGDTLGPAVSRVVLVPAVAGLVVAAVVVLVLPEVRGSGVNHTKAAVYIYDGFIPFRTVFGKFLTCSVSIGSGHSLGPEDPSLQIGAGLASLFGRWLRLSRDHLRLLAPVGAAAGLAAAFNSPITAVLFVIEEVIGTWSAGVLGAVVLSAVSGAVTAQWFLGDEPLFRVPTYHLEHPSELVAYALLGVIGGIAALAFVKPVLSLRSRIRRRPRRTLILAPAMAGLAIGMIGVRFPQVMGAGYEFVDQAMHGQYTWQLLAALAVLKIVATGLSFVSGVPGGLFAPTLFIGAMIGGAVHGVVQIVLPDQVGPTGAYVLVGMGTLLAAILRAPITSVFMIVEVSGNYSIILPVMISNTIGYLISRRFQPHPIFDALSQQDGVALPSMEEQRETTVQRVEDAIRRRAPFVFTGEDSIDDAWRRARESNLAQYPVRLAPDVWTLVSVEALENLRAEGKGDLALGSVLGLSDRLPWVHPDQPLEAALRLIGDRAFLPVVHRANVGQLEGIVTLDDILSAYRRPRDG